MLTTTRTRMLIGDWEPPTTKTEEPAPAPTEQTMTDRYYRYHKADSAGITFQRCGGGRRIIRKRIGGN